ncbi:MAG: tetratricopeptide repeat protein [Candidatus Aminicenantes bacterium]|nr:tetratricopeptide repeat protein [Candidatus Aminicenantes bacterium]
MAGDLPKAIAIYQDILKRFPGNREVAAQALLRMGQCHEKLGNAEARAAYERVVREYADQAGIVAQARARLAVLGGPAVTGGLVARRVLTDASGVDGVLTADGKYISNLDQDTGDVVQFDVASGQSSRIKNRVPWSEKGKTIGLPAFSRDGKQIAYSSYTQDEVSSQLQIRNLDGSGLRTLYREKDSLVGPLDWSPDAGFILAFRLRESSVAIDGILISTADGSVRVLRSNIAWATTMRSPGTANFSPDGRFVAFSAGHEGSSPRCGVFLMTADGRNEVVVAGHPAENQLLGWTPDGRSLVFLSDRSGTWDIWSVHITGGKQQGEPELLKKDFSWDSDILGFAPDGSLYYRTNVNLGRLYIGTVDLETGKILAPPAPVTTRYMSQPYLPQWSPDGKSLVYVSHSGALGPGNDLLAIRSAATGEERFLSQRLPYINDISWAPEGHSIIGLRSTEIATAFVRIDTETNRIDLLMADPPGRSPRLCSDGKTLVYLKAGTKEEGNELFITKRNLDTGEESKVAKIEDTSYHHGSYDLSPDGRDVVFQVAGAVKTVSLGGGEPRELFRGSAQAYGLRWTRDGRNIIARAIYPMNGDIWRVPAQGGTPLKLDLSIKNMHNFSLNPDNRRFSFSVSEGSKNELWVMENFLPKEKSAGLSKSR